MIALAVLLLVLVLAIVVYIVVTGTTETVRLEWEQLNLAWEPNALLVFLLGALALLLLGLALGLIQAGTKKSVQRRRELKRLRESDRERDRAGSGEANDQDTHRTPPAGSSRPDRPNDRDDSWYDTPPDRR